MSLINDLKRNLVNAEELGNEEWAKALKARIKAEEKLAAQVEELPTDQKVDDVLAAVGEDPVLAAAALEVEQGRDKPRKTLVSQLEALAKPEPLEESET